ncbi:MAG TPA: urease accessory protein UreD [Bryobacteraceae bacterium]|jgi:urease accessory protein|nr:urease accessory protein UreD [Bryobacteraceae bacterium]
MASSNLHMSFEANETGETILRVKQQQPPWRVVRGFRAASGETLAHMHNLSGGILDSDSLHCQIDVGSAAQAQVTSTGATRIYRSRSPGSRASQCVRANIASGGYLEYVPDQLIPFAGSRFDQAARIEMERGGSLIWCDRVAPGREASEEIFRFESLTSQFELVAEGKPVAIERWSLTPLVTRLDSIARLGPFRHFASCYVCRAGEPASYWKNFESQLQKHADQLCSTEVLWGVTSLRAHGLVIRGLAVSGRSLASGLVELWKAAKWILCGRVATLPRKVH